MRPAPGPTPSLMIASVALAAASQAACRHGGAARDRAAAAPPAAEQGPAAYRARVAPVLGRYCGGCHGNGKKKGDVALDGWASFDALVADRGTWQAVLERVEGREMPPEDEPQPSAAERRLVAAWIEANVLGCDGRQPDPGRVTARRLNRTEYDNTIRDLLGVDFKPAADFPVDNSGFGFDNIGEALSLTPTLAEKYLRAADRVLDAALFSPGRARPRTLRFAVDALEVGYNARRMGDGSALLNSFEEDDVAASLDVPFEAAYLVRVRAYALQDRVAPTKYARIDAPEAHAPVKLTFMVDDAVAEVLEVAATMEAPGTYEARVRAPPGPRRFRAVVRRRKDGLSPAEAAIWKNGEQQKGAVVVQHMEIEGPLEVDGRAAADTHRRVFFRPVARGEERAAAREIIGRFTRRAFRRPASPAEVAGLVGLAEAAWARGDGFEAGVRVALKAVLVSPHFLFRTELRLRPDDPAAVHVLDEHALASRLAYFLWSSMPDDRLFARASRGELRRELDGEVRRMLADPKARALVESFGGQWLQVRNLDHVQPDKKRFPRWNEALRRDMRRETELLFETIVREDRSVLDFLAADFTFVNGRLAALYGIPGVTGEELRRVSLAGTQRRGVLTHASVLTLTSNPTRTSPVKRGKWVLEALLAAPPPPPPPEVPDLGDEKQLEGTLRQRMERHRADPACASCHARMDPIGFGLETFDALGAHRTADNGAPVDARGRLVSGEAFDGPLELNRILLGPKRDAFVRALASHLLTYALGRGLEPFDRCTLDRITREVAADGYRFSRLVLSIVNSVPFQRVRGESPASPAVAAREETGTP